VLPRILFEPAEHLGVHSCHAGRRFQEPLAVGIFADADQNLANGALDARQIDAADSGRRPCHRERAKARALFGPIARAAAADQGRTVVRGGGIGHGNFHYCNKYQNQS
jgi:hypothetical protein